MSVLETQFIFDSKVVISCGRKSVIPSIALKKNIKIKFLQYIYRILKYQPNQFDLIICPEHDNLKGENIIKTVGAIHYLSIKEIDREKII